MNAADDLASVTALRNSFIKAFNANDASAVTDLYTADAVLMNDHTPTATGHDAIPASNKAFFEQLAASIEVTPDETETVGTYGFDRGHYKMTMTPKAGGPATTEDGRYLVLLQKGTDGGWKVRRDIGNTPTPMPPPMAMPMAGAPGRGGKGK